SATSRFGWMSGWVWSTPVSVNATRTYGRPCVIAYEPVSETFMRILSHCSEPRSSGSGCGSAPAPAVLPPRPPRCLCERTLTAAARSCAAEDAPNDAVESDGGSDVFTDRPAAATEALADM